MSYTPNSDTFRTVSIDACGTDLGDPVGGSIDSTVEFIRNRPGTRISPSIAMQSFDVNCVGKYQTQQNPVTPGTMGDFVITVLTIDGNPIAVTCSDCMAGGTKMDFSSEKHVNSFDCTFNAGDTENLSPISVG